MTIPFAKSESRIAKRRADQPVDVELVNARELAKILSVSERTLYRLKSTGELPTPVVLGGSVRWRLSEIRQWIANGCPRPVKPK